MKKIQFLVITLIFIGNANLAQAASIEEYLTRGFDAYQDGDFDKALDIFEAGYQEHPGKIEFVFSIAEAHQKLGNYDIAIGNYLNILTALQKVGDSPPVEIHDNLARAYDSLGQERYYSQELCLRVIYHLELLFADFPDWSSKPKYQTLIQRVLNEYAKSDNDSIQNKESLKLYPDDISRDKKLVRLTKALDRLPIDQRPTITIKKQPKPVPVPDNVNAVIKVITDKMQRVDSLEYSVAVSGSQAFEQILYAKPNLYKSIQSQNIQTIIRDGTMYMLDPATDQMVDFGPTSLGQLPILRRVGLDNLYQELEDYNLAMIRLSKVPESLQALYSQGRQPYLYQLSGSLKDPTKGPYPPRPRVEIIVDVNLGLVVAIRDYWPGPVGDENAIRLAKEELIVDVQEIQGDYFPSRGRTVGHVGENSEVTRDWEIQELKVNHSVDPKEFSIQ